MNYRITLKVQDKDDLYYDAMDAIAVNDYISAEKMLLKAKEIDPDYVQTYVGLVSVYAKPENKAKRIEATNIAFQKVLNQFPKWPKKMEWGFLENRAYLRAIQYKADLYWDEKNEKDAEKLFRLLLKLNPNDNQGVRYEIAAMFAGISGKKLNQMFDEGNRKQDWSRLEKLVKDQNSIHYFWKEPRY